MAPPQESKGNGSAAAAGVALALGDGLALRVEPVDVLAVRAALRPVVDGGPLAADEALVVVAVAGHALGPDGLGLLVAVNLHGVRRVDGGVVAALDLLERHGFLLRTWRCAWATRAGRGGCRRSRRRSS